MARPKEFDRDKALLAAIGVFCLKPYQSTSIDDLLEAMNIGRQSFYDTFGDKRSLYIEAFIQRSTTMFDRIKNLCHETDSALCALEKILFYLAKAPECERTLGCIEINAICEFGQSDKEIFGLTQGAHQKLESLLTMTIAKAKEAGEIPQKINDKTAANFILTILIGMKVRAKAGATPEALHCLAVFALNSLVGPS